MVNRTLKPLVVAVAMANAGIMTPALAQTGGQPVLEEVVVTGIRQSLKAAADLKRDSAGVVDAITAEDMGKFPDTNLAESLQRITGVSIDRVNGEGSKVTVRGFGADFNQITLNGRLMPSANLEDSAASASRSFDFSQLSSDAVSAVEVYKTGKARLASGGLGSTINIQTMRPLDKPGLTASISAGALHDSTNVEGDDFTPDISGIYSNSFFDDTVGIMVNGSYQERDSGIRTGETSSGWNTFVSDGSEYQDFTNPPQAGDVVGIAQNFLYTLQDVEQKRTNYQLALQWEPIESLRATLDYTYSELEKEQHRQELSAWFGAGDALGGEFSGGAIKAPVVFNGVGGDDVAMAVGDWGRKTETESIGFNLAWSPTDNLSLAFDYHNSTAEAQPKDDRGSNNIVTAASFIRGGGGSTSMRYGPDMAQMLINTSTGQPATQDEIIGSGNSFRNSYMKTEIEQTRLDGTFAFDEAFMGLESIDFGLNHAEVDNRSAFAAVQGGDWGSFGYTGHSSGGGWNATAGDGDGNFDNAAFTQGNLPGEFDELSAGPDVNSWYYDVDYDQFTSDIRAFYDANPELAGGQPLNAWSDCADGKLCAPSQYTDDRQLSEKQTAVYLQLNFHWELGDMPTNLGVGLRYDDTEVDSKSLAPNYNSLLWLTGNELQLQAQGSTFLSGEGSYDYWLPNVDFDIEVIEGAVLRASYSKTISRPNYTDLQAGRTVNSQARTDVASTGNGGDPNLQPFESQNFDFSSEWYYSEGSYVSIGYYMKKVDNFIGTSIVNNVVYPELVQPASGTRYAEAVAAIGDSSDVNRDVLDYYRDQGWVDAVSGELLGSLASYDPLSFALTVPVNSEDAEIDGFELAIQHMFGDSGFGVIANYTTVEGDIEYDNETIGVDQFALLGLSDTYNLIGFYDKNGYQARLAYNWRDEFLDKTVQGNNQQEPIYVEEYGQLDLSLSYTWNDRLTVYAEGINLTEDIQRKHGRTDDMVIATIETGVRYSMGLRYKF